MAGIELMNGTWSTLIAVIIGGLISVVGAVVVDWIRNKREREHVREERRLDRDRDDKERLRVNIYDLQDDLIQVFEQYQIAIETKRKPDLYTRENNAALNNTLRRLTMRSLRIGDSPLSEHISRTLAKLAEARGTADPDEAERLFYEASNDPAFAHPIAYRIGMLLHTDTKPNYNV